MPVVPQTFEELKARAIAAYTPANVEAIRDKHRLSGAISVDAMQSFLINAGTVYLTQKLDQDQHQAPSRLKAELKAIRSDASSLLERLERFPAHVHDFHHSRLLKQ